MEAVVNSMKYGVICALVLPVIVFFDYKNSAIEIIKKIGINSKYYPKHYVSVNRWMKKFYKIRESQVPWYLYIRLILAIYHLFLCLICLIIFAISLNIELIFRIIMFQIYLDTIDTTVFIIMTFIYKKGQKNKKKNTRDGSAS